jgi:hypothetical protein
MGFWWQPLGQAGARAAALDGLQAVKHTCNASVESKGFCFYKATNGSNAIWQSIF